MNKKFVYFYLMKSSDKIRQVVPSHVEYWKNCGMEEYMSGPFADRSDGLISFAAINIEDATGIIMEDPFIKENLIENKWIKEWSIDTVEV